jgi:hypothetical protein
MSERDSRPDTAVRTKATTRAALAGLALACTSAAAQIGQGTGAVPGFPQFYESHIATDCPEENECSALFAPVPRSTLLEATNISCHGTGTNTGNRNKPATFVLDHTVGSARSQRREFFSAPPNDPSERFVLAKYTFNRSIRTFFTGGSRPSITFFSASRLECKLSGTLVPADSNVSPTE